MLSKPPSCKLCRFSYLSTGFVPDTGEETAKIAVVLDSPSRSDVLDQGYWKGHVGRVYEDRYLTPLGLQRKDVLFSAVLRCKPPVNDWPDKRMGEIGASCCRHYDQALREWRPDLAIVTFSLLDVAKTPALFRLVLAAFEKAVRFQQRGFRPVVLMGGHASELLLPWTGGSAKKWAGTHMEIRGWL